MKPGAYYHEGGSDIVFGLWFLTGRGKWLFSVPVEGSVWKIAEDQSGEKKIPLLGAKELEDSYELADHVEAIKKYLKENELPDMTRRAFVADLYDVLREVGERV